MHTKLRQVFEDFYYQQTGEAYYWTGKDGRSLKLLIAKMRFSFKSKRGVDATDKDIEDVFVTILNLLPEWHKEHLDLAIINSNYASIISSIKRNKKVRSKMDLSILKQQINERNSKA